MSLPKGSDFLPPWPLRSGHIQTMLSSSGVRRRLLPKRAHRVQVGAREVLVDVGQGDRLSGRYTAQTTGRESRGLAILFHGWEGSVDSTYVLQTGSRLLEDGWDVFRLNFRDHGDSHGLNEALFHSCRIDEVVTALGEIARMFPAKTIGVAGFSLGGNFALRAAMLAPSQGVPLDYVVTPAGYFHASCVVHVDDGRGHHVAHGLAAALVEIAAGDDAHEAVVLVEHREALVARSLRARLFERL